jgi:hypothetical protein
MALSESEFLRLAEDAIRKGPEALAEFMLDQLAKMPHSHTADEILDFDESVTQIIEDGGEGEEE